MKDQRAEKVSKILQMHKVSHSQCADELREYLGLDS